MKILSDSLEAFSRMRAIDGIDIAIVSVMVFVALRIIHRHIHRRVVITLTTLVVTYLIARAYQLTLTVRLIELVGFSAGAGAVLNGAGGGSQPPAARRTAASRTTACGSAAGARRNRGTGGR